MIHTSSSMSIHTMRHGRVATQAGVPFFYCSGSDFVELFVGRGAARMRALFKEAQVSRWLACERLIADTAPLRFEIPV